MSSTGESDVLARARGGDKEAFESLLEPVIGMGARLAYGMLLDRTEAEDVVQEAAVKAWLRLGNVRPGTDFKPWFLGIVANECRTVRRGRWWSTVRLDQPVSAGAADSEASVVRGADLRRALARLPADQRAALLLHFYLDLPLDDVATSLGISIAGAKSRINRAFKRLRPALASSEVVT
jgi:RNA polymerase sigma-70 factor (ECF subfamily)